MNSKLQELRQELNSINSHILKQLLIRFETLNKVFTHKQQAQLPTIDKQRRAAMQAQLELNIKPEYKQYIMPIINECFDQSERFMNEKTRN